MPHDITLITTLAAALGLAALLGLAAAYLKMPPLVGYLLAGIVIGPATPGYVAHLGLAAQLAEIGIILMMFGVGLHFSLNDLLKVKKIAVPGALVQIAVATFLGMLAAQRWGWNIVASIIFGLSLSVASTIVLLRALESRGLLLTLNGQIATGWLVVEDLVMVLTLVLLPPIAEMLGSSGTIMHLKLSSEVFRIILLTVFKVIIFIALMIIIGKRLLPWLLKLVAQTGSRELFTLCVAATALSVAVGAAKLFDVSTALGAFFAGMMMRESEFSHRAATESLPLREAFSVLFFVSVGMLFDPKILWLHPWQVFMVTGIILVGKTIAAMGLVWLFQYPFQTALVVGASLAQIGEFSFILSGLGVELGLLPPDGRNLILTAALISIALNPLLFKLLVPSGYKDGRPI